MVEEWARPSPKCREGVTGLTKTAPIVEPSPVAIDCQVLAGSGANHWHTSVMVRGRFCVPGMYESGSPLDRERARQPSPFSALHSWTADQ